MALKLNAKPSPYTFLPFHIIRTCQLVSSFIVAGIMIYFLKELQHDHYRLPWTFILLLSASLLTLLTLLTTALLHAFSFLTPTFNLILNGPLTVLWTLSFALLTWWSSGTLGHICNRLNWETSTGIMVCRIYKVLFSFAFLASLATAAALGLDIRTIRKEAKRGRFVRVEQEEREMKTVFEAEGDRDDGLRERTGGGSRARAWGYTVPEEQFQNEDDISYNGAAR